MCGRKYNENPSEISDKLLLVVHLLILVGKHQTELTVKLYICGSEKAQKFAGSLPKFSTFQLLAPTWEKPILSDLRFTNCFQLAARQTAN